MGKLEEQGMADYKFTRAVVDPADEIDFSGETKYVIQEGKKTYTKAELEAIDRQIDEKAKRIAEEKVLEYLEEIENE